MNGNEGIGTSGSMCAKPSAVVSSMRPRSSAIVRPDAAITRGPAGEAREAFCRLLDIGHRDGQAAQAVRAVGMRQPARLPDHVLRPVGEDLDAALRHLACLQSRHRERGGPGCAAGIDRALHLHQRPHAKAQRAEPPMGGSGVRHREGGKMHAAIARQPRLELAAERRYRRS